MGESERERELERGRESARSTERSFYFIVKSLVRCSSSQYTCASNKNWHFFFYAVINITRAFSVQRSSRLIPIVCHRPCITIIICRYFHAQPTFSSTLLWLSSLLHVFMCFVARKHYHLCAAPVAVLREGIDEQTCNLRTLARNV